MQAQSPDMDVHGDRESPLHEPSTIRLRGMIWFFVWFVIIGIVLHVLLYVLYRAYLADAKKENVPITGLSGDVARSIPPKPRLQPSLDHDQLPRIDMDELQARELADFRRRGWVDDKTNQVSIPSEIINQVMQMTQAGAPATRSSR